MTVLKQGKYRHYIENLVNMGHYIETRINVNLKNKQTSCVGYLGYLCNSNSRVCYSTMYVYIIKP